MDAPLLLLEPDPAEAPASGTELRLGLGVVHHLVLEDRTSARRVFDWVSGRARPPRGRVVVDGLELLDLSPEELREWRLHSVAAVSPPFPLAAASNGRGGRASLGEGLRTALALGGEPWSATRRRAAILERTWTEVLRGVSPQVEARLVPVAWATARSPVLVVLLRLREGLDRDEREVLDRALAPLAQRSCSLLHVEVAREEPE